MTSEQLLGTLQGQRPGNIPAHGNAMGNDYSHWIEDYKPAT